MPPSSPPPALDRIGAVLRRTWLAVAAVLAIECLIYVVALADADLLVGAGSILAEGAALATGPAALTGVHRLLARSRGRGNGALLVLVGVLGGGYLLLLVGIGTYAPVCDFGGGDACVYGTTGAPPWYALPRSLALLVVCACVLVALVRCCDRELMAWLTRARSTPEGRSAGPATVFLAVSAAAGLAISAVNFPATVQRVSTSVADSQFLVDEAATEAYGAACWVAGTGLVVAFAVAALAALARREPARWGGAVRVLGGLVALGQLLWTYLSLALNPVGWRVSNRFHLVESTLPAWYPPTLSTLVVVAALATLTATALLALAAPATARSSARSQ